LAILVSSVFGAAIADVLFTDVIPIRPYDIFFKWVPQFQSVAGSEHVKIVFTSGLLILFLMALLPTLANLTTGITMAHTGFTPNPNVTATPGFVTAIRTMPLVAIGVGLGFALDDLGTIL